jgi:hypothetical protein
MNHPQVSHLFARRWRRRRRVVGAGVEVMTGEADG